MRCRCMCGGDLGEDSGGGYLGVWTAMHDTMSVCGSFFFHYAKDGNEFIVGK